MNTIDTAEILGKIKNGTFVQIGSHDGVSNDEFGLKEKLMNEDHIGILIEPIKEFYHALVTNYSKFKSKISFENIAISNKQEIKRICLDGQDTSFVRNTKNNFIEVYCEHFNYILDKYDIKKIDGLFIDVEGYEEVILESIFKDCKVEIDFIRYEFWWLNDKNRLDQLLLENGYDVFMDNKSYADKIAIRKFKS